jgi:hypothetical protein
VAVVARAQQPAVPVIGFLFSEAPDPVADRLRAFRHGLKETGYVEGENVAIETAGPTIKSIGSTQLMTGGKSGSRSAVPSKHQLGRLFSE